MRVRVREIVTVTVIVAAVWSDRLLSRSLARRTGEERSRLSERAAEIDLAGNLKIDGAFSVEHRHGQLQIFDLGLSVPILRWSPASSDTSGTFFQLIRVLALCLLLGLSAFVFEKAVKPVNFCSS